MSINDTYVFLRMAGTVSMLLPQEAWICWISGQARSAKLSYQRSQKVHANKFLSFLFSQTYTTILPGIFDVMAVFNATNEYVLYYHSGRKTIRAFRRKEGTMIANFRVQADLKGMATTGDGRSVVLGMGDGSMTTLTIADPDKTDIAQYLKSLPSRNPENVNEMLRFFIRFDIVYF